jgi:hypothetical protein
MIIGPQGASDWSFRKDGTATSVRIDGRPKIPAPEGALTAATAGVGIVMATAAAIRRELDNGSLVLVLAEWDMGLVDMHAVFNGGHAAKSSARAFVGCLRESLQVASARRLQLLISKYSLVRLCKLVLSLGVEVACIMTLAKLFGQVAAHAVDQAPALYSWAGMDAIGPALYMLVVQHRQNSAAPYDQPLASPGAPIRGGKCPFG